MADYFLYTALAGDNFDSIALDFYDEESYAPVLLQANPQHRNIILFAGGEQLKVPVIAPTPTAGTLPPWKRGNSR